MTDAAQRKLAAAQPGLTPWKVVQTFSPDEWEEFVVEWADGFDPAYRQVVRLGGAGDKGRDVVGYSGDPTDPACPWDSYQCKHYDHALRPTDVYAELGKLCVFTFRGDYGVPNSYRFIAPRGVGTKLHDLLKKPQELRRELASNWQAYCERGISDAEAFPLVGPLKEYVEAFDFRIVWFLTPQELLTQHSRTKHWHRRFKLDPPERPAPEPPPPEVRPHELPYVRCLLEAYGDHLKTELRSTDDLAGTPKLDGHFRRSRGYFFSAEALARFSRDLFSAGAFDAVKGHVHDGVVEVVFDNTHADGLARVVGAATAAAALPLPQSDLAPYVWPADKMGLRHHLANDGRLCWVQS